MKARLLLAGILSVSLVLAHHVSAVVGPPTATKYQANLTTPPLPTGATINIGKPSKVLVKVSSQNVTFQLKMSGVADASDSPVTLMNNTLQVDVQTKFGFFTLNFPFNLDTGKVNLKSIVANTDAGSWGGALAAGDTVEIRGARVIQGGNGNAFGVSGITLK